MKVAIIGAGPAGMMAAITASKNHQVILIDGNEKVGKKLFITGKGRCNVTNAKDISEFFDFIPGNPHFLYSALYTFTNEDTIKYFEGQGIKLKTERGGRVFPLSDKSSDIIKGLEKGLQKENVKLLLNSRVKDIVFSDSKINKLILENNDIVEADYFIIATGGASYQTTGSKGDGQRFAKKLGHNIIKLTPSLVPIEIEDDYVKRLMGLSLKNVTAAIYDGKKELYKDFGEMLFTHFGVSGPLILTGSSYISKQIKKGPLRLIIDLKPALTKEQLDARILREFEEGMNKQFKNVLGSLFPSKLIPVMIDLSGIEPEKKVNEISRAERERFVNLIKGFELTITSLRGWNEAIITRGGVSVKEINPSTMESKNHPGIYFVGEVLDLDAKTGGFNLQIAWSTAYLAGISV